MFYLKGKLFQIRNDKVTGFLIDITMSVLSFNIHFYKTIFEAVNYDIWHGSNEEG